MKIIQARTGSAAVVAPSLGVIFVDPGMGPDATVDAIRAALPTAHRDQVEHWVRTATPPMVAPVITG
ncbi:hypothetical protein AB0L34_13965 [Micromonospora sp. NPDC052213]|uniref:hypothetical protein n=1 Tax=Micromonospora sp. NPDC052213 TaxID=3155812 RepID=UPI00342FB972